MLILETNKISLKPGTSLVVYMKIRALYSRYMFVCVAGSLTVWSCEGEESLLEECKGRASGLEEILLGTGGIGQALVGAVGDGSQVVGCATWGVSAICFTDTTEQNLLAWHTECVSSELSPVFWKGEQAERLCVCVPTAEQCVKTVSPSHTGQEKGKTKSSNDVTWELREQPWSCQPNSGPQRLLSFLAFLFQYVQFSADPEKVFHHS